MQAGRGDRCMVRRGDDAQKTWESAGFALRFGGFLMLIGMLIAFLAALGAAFFALF